MLVAWPSKVPQGTAVKDLRIFTDRRDLIDMLQTMVHEKQGSITGRNDRKGKHSADLRFVFLYSKQKRTKTKEGGASNEKKETFSAGGKG